MTAPEVELRAAWHRVVGPHHHQGALDSLLARLREPHRRYHTATHVMWVLRHIDQLHRAGRPQTDDLAAVRLAALYHDAVYQPDRGDNEAVSAQLAAEVAATLDWSTARVEVVHDLVIATASHHPLTADQVVLVDADLAILGSSPGDYSAYVAGVRAEYSHVPDTEWRVGRAALLERFLAQPVLFHSETMREQREARARANLTAERASLLDG